MKKSFLIFEFLANSFLIFPFFIACPKSELKELNSVWKRPVVYRCRVDGRHVHSSQYSSLEDLAFQSGKKLL
jgi:hypothetical protein